MDLLMPVTDGTETAAAIRSEMPEVEVMALTGVLGDASSVTGAIKAGATGHLLKATEVEELHRATKGLLREVRDFERSEELTERGAETSRLLARRMADKQVLSELVVEVKTGEVHLSSILGKLGAHSPTQAALRAVRTGLVGVDELGWGS